MSDGPPEAHTAPSVPTDAPDPTRAPRFRPDRVFLIIAAICCTVFTFTLPAFGGYDEPVHFLRAWQLSDGGVFAREITRDDGTRDVGGDIPDEAIRQIRVLIVEGPLSPGDAADAFAEIDAPNPRGHRSFVGFASAAVYPPVPYLPSAIALRVSRLLGLSIFASALLARLANVGAFVALGTLAIRRLPQRGTVLAAVLLAPVMLLQAATVSADALTICLAFLVVAQAFRLAATPTPDVPRVALIETGVATFALALAKPPYILAASALLLPAWRHRARIAAALGATLAASAAVATAWNVWARARFIAPALPEVNDLPNANFAYHDVDPGQQFAYVRNHPFDFLRAIGRTLTTWGGDIAHDVVAQTGWWRAPTLIAACVALVIVAVAVTDATALSRGAATWCGAIAVAIFFSVMLLAYSGWNAVGAPRIDAFQGRYLTPVLALLALSVVRAPQRLTTIRAGAGGTVALLGAQGVLALMIAAGMGGHFYL